jgi:hypothetical protein
MTGVSGVLNHQGDYTNDRKSKKVWNVGQFLRDHTAQHFTRQSPFSFLITLQHIQFRWLNKGDFVIGHWLRQWEKVRTELIQQCPHLHKMTKQIIK